MSSLKFYKFILHIFSPLVNALDATDTAAECQVHWNRLLYLKNDISEQGHNHCKRWNHVLIPGWNQLKITYEGKTRMFGDWR